MSFTGAQGHHGHPGHQHVGDARRSSSSSSDVAGDVDGRDGRLPAPEDPVLHVLDVEARAAEQVEDLREHADPVEVADSERARARAGGRRG